MRDKKDNSKKKQRSVKKDPPPFEEAFDRCFPEWCEALDSYTEIINFARSEEYGLESDEYTEVHHIVPRSWYEKHGYRIDNSEANTVRLRMRDHYRAHFYARLCCSSEVKRSLQCAFNMMGNILKCDVPEEWLDEKAILVEVQKCEKKFGANGSKGKHLSDETRRKQSEAMKGKRVGEKNPMYGKHFHHSKETKQRLSEVHKGKPKSKETRRKISENHADMKGEKNPYYGKYHSEETKQKISEAHRKCEHCSLTDPDGQAYDIYDLYEFCKHHFENVRNATSHLRHYGVYHGWKYQIQEEQ